MSQLNVDTIKKADGTGNLSVPAETGTVVTTASPSLGRRNLIINGGMVISQRYGTASTNFTSGSIFSVDRFMMQSTDTTEDLMSSQQVTDAPAGFSNSLKITSGSATSFGSGDYALISQPIEGYNLASLSWGTSDAKTATLSFWVKSSLTGTFGGVFEGGGGSNASYPFTYAINSADTWEYKTITVEGSTQLSSSTTNGVGIFLRFTMGVGSTYAGTAGSWSTSRYFGASGATDIIATSGATWQITGVQLEVGDTATPFEHRSYGEELALCQRYYCHNRSPSTPPSMTSYYYYENSAMAVDFEDASPTSLQFPVTMRANPTMQYGRLYSYNAAVYKDITGGSVSRGGGGVIYHNGGYTLGRPGVFGWIADAEL